jgi:hypothetical protein
MPVRHVRLKVSLMAAQKYKTCRRYNDLGHALIVANTLLMS